MPLKKMTAVGLLAILLGCANSIQAVLVPADWDRQRSNAEAVEEDLLLHQLPDQGLERGDGPVDPLILRPRPVPGTVAPYKPPYKPQPAPRPKAPPKAGGPTAGGGTGTPTGPKPTPPITRPS